MTGAQIELLSDGVRVELSPRHQAAIQRCLRRRFAVAPEWDVCPLAPCVPTFDPRFVHDVLPLLLADGSEGDADARTLAAIFKFAAIGLVVRGFGPEVRS